MTKCHVALVDLIKPAVASLGDALLANGLIPQDSMETLRMSSVPAADKARIVVGCLASRIKHDKNAYREFVSILKKQDLWSQFIAEMLTSYYKAQTATLDSLSVSLKSSESQCKLLAEFEIPCDPKDGLQVALKNMKIRIQLVSAQLCL